MKSIIFPLICALLATEPIAGSDGYVEAKQAFVRAFEESLPPEQASKFDESVYIRVPITMTGQSLPANIRLFLLAPKLEAISATVANAERRHHPTLLVWNMETQSLVAFRELQEECGAIASANLQQINFDEDPEQELFLTLVTNCIASDKLTSVRLERLLGFDYPSLEPLFGVDGAIMVYGQDNADLLPRKHEVVPSPIAGAFELRVQDIKSGETVTVGNSTEREARFSSRAEGIAASEDFQPKRGTVTCRVVDEKGNPIPSVQAQTRLTSLNIFGLVLLDMEKVTEATALSDSSGLVEIPYNRNGVSAFFGHKGHRQQQISFVLSEDDVTHSIHRLIDGSVQTIVMPSDLDRVLLHMNARPARIPLDLHEAPFEFGISFEEDYKKSAELNPRWIAEMGDLVVRIERSGKVTITGRNGWQLQAAPPEYTKERISANKIHEVPETGYGPQLEFGRSQLSSVIYLSKDGGRRYGVLTDITIVPVDFEPQNKVEFTFHYRVQAEATGSRSLQPL
jgi:hypothetical protein